MIRPGKTPSDETRLTLLLGWTLSFWLLSLAVCTRHGGVAKCAFLALALTRSRRVASCHQGDFGYGMQESHKTYFA